MPLLPGALWPYALQCTSQQDCPLLQITFHKDSALLLFKADYERGGSGILFHYTLPRLTNWVQTSSLMG